MDYRSGYCRGCGRTMDEIRFWDRLNDAERADVVAMCQRRLAGQAPPLPREIAGNRR